MNRIKTIIGAAGVMIIAAMSASTAETLVFDQPETAGMSGLRAHWDKPLQVTEDGKREQKDGVVKDRGQSAVWNGREAGPLAFDAVHRHLLVRFPGAAEKIAEALAAGKAIEKVELVLPYLDEELWPTGSGGADFPSADGYRYRMNRDVDKMHRNSRPNWHAVAWLLRKPWAADSAVGPTYNAAINGAADWKRFGASDTNEDRFSARLGPAEVSSCKPDGRMDVTAVLADSSFGKTVAERLLALADCGFIVSKQEVYDSRYHPLSHAYEWAISTGPRAILVKRPQLVVMLRAGKAEKATLPPAVAVMADAADSADGVEVTGCRTKQGWTLSASVPLPCMGIAPEAGSLALDLVVNTHRQPGEGCRLHLAGEENPYRGSCRYLVVRL